MLIARMPACLHAWCVCVHACVFVCVCARLHAWNVTARECIYVHVQLQRKSCMNAKICMCVVRSCKLMNMRGLAWLLKYRLLINSLQILAQLKIIYFYIFVSDSHSFRRTWFFIESKKIKLPSGSSSKEINGCQAAMAANVVVLQLRLFVIAIMIVQK